MVEELRCSLQDCAGEIIGKGVILADDGFGIPWVEYNLGTYLSKEEEEVQEWVVLHPNCFRRLFDAFEQAEKQTALHFIFGSVTDIRAALEM